MSNETQFELWMASSKRAMIYAGLLGKYKSLTGNLITLVENLKKSDRGYLIDLEYLKKVKQEIETEFEETVKVNS